MSGKIKQPAQVEQLESRVSLCETNPVNFLSEVQRLVLAGYRLDLSADLTMFMNVYTATLVLPEA